MRVSKRLEVRRGTASIYLIVMFTVLIGLCSLAVDWGQIQMAKTELERATDAAARYAVTGLSDGTTLTKANTLGTYNTVNGNALVFQSTDVVVGTWNNSNNTFAVGGASPNAVKVTGRRTAANGNPIRLTFAALIGKGSCDIISTATAMQVVSTNYGVVGLNWIKMSGGATYASGTPSPQMASNGDITLSGSATVNGDAHPGVGKSVSTSGSSSVTGSSTSLTTPLSYPNANAGTYATSNSNSNVPGGNMNNGNFTLSSGNLTLPGGTYYFKDFTVSGSGSLTFSGPATIYCYGTFTLSGSANTLSNSPGNLNIDMCPDVNNNPPGKFTISGSSAFYGNVYAPQSDVTVSGGGNNYGTVVGLDITLSGGSQIYQQLSSGGSNGTITLVQ